MADAELEARLQSHTRTFEGLMSLIPAKDYYAKDNTDQWQRKKQTKEQKRAARKEKLKPENMKSAKDIMDENERKRKREIEEAETDEHIDLNDPSMEKPREGMKPPKKQKLDKEIVHTNHQGDSSEKGGSSGTTLQKTKAEKRKEKRKAKAEKAVRQREKAEAKKNLKLEARSAEAAEKVEVNGEVSGDVDADITMGNLDVEAVDLNGEAEDTDQVSRSSVTPTPVTGTPQSPGQHSASSSISSIVPPTADDLSDKTLSAATSTAENIAFSTADAITPETQSASNSAITNSNDSSKPRKLPKLPEINQELLRARLQARIDALRAARKADGPDGKPARNRQELLDQRRKKEEERKQRKKEARRKQKEADGAKTSAVTQDAKLEGRGQSNGYGTENNFSYGNIQFGDGQQVDSFGNIISAQRRKGPSDVKTALEAAKKKEARIAGLDDEKRADIESKDAWLNAKKRVHGETVRDDTALLNKTVKKKEKAKSKSAKEWNDRIEGVKKGKEARQKKREENLRKRKESKGQKGNKNKGIKTQGNKKKRPGFEGSFRTKR
ncbi:MAG: hypothetical protein M1820_009470 [Bogoriella megaspora]|nr:MAG: hypothetical protein M1820_009470 [Bogoriella megaspora]